MSEPLWTLRVPDPGCGWLSANGGQGRSPYPRARKVKRWREAAAVRARAGGAPRLARARIIVVVHRSYGTGRADAANLQPTAKAVIDGLVDARLLPDDDDSRLVGPDMRRGPNVTRAGASPYLEVLVYAHPDDEGSQASA